MAKRFTTLADYFDSPKAMSRAQAAARWSVTEATISRWIHGQRSPRGWQAILVSEDTGVPLSALIGNKEAA
jgi:phosphopantetheinyl transferase (holo-ACP synthase)